MNRSWALAGVLLVGLVGCSAAAQTRDEQVRAAPTEVTRVVEEVAVDYDRALAERLGALSLPDGVRLAVAVLDQESGASAAYGDGAYDTASIVKVDILAALLLQAQDAGRPLTAQEKVHADAMIRLSDNDAATALWKAVGGAEGLSDAHDRLGLTATAAPANGTWGLTQTTATDQLALLRAVFGTDSELAADSRTYIQDLMARTAADQDWGVSAAGSPYALKNGWLPRTSSGLWDINSIGRVTTADGRTCLVAVLSDGHAAKEAGVSLVEAAARAAVSALGGTS